MPTPNESMRIVQPASGIRILVIDDDEPFRTFVGLVLRKHGFDVISAGDGVEGLALAAASIPDLILCDLQMPRGDGFEVLDALHKHRSLAAVPVILLTGRSAPAQVRLGMNRGADDYLTKPVSPTDLLDAITARLARVRRLRRPKAEPEPPLEESKHKSAILIKTLSEARLVEVAEITRIIAYGEYCWVYWGKGKKAMLRKSLKAWLAELPSNFVRVHRQAIINLQHMDRIETPARGGTQVWMQGTSEPIPVSLRMAPMLNRKLRELQSKKTDGTSSSEGKCL